MTNVWCSLTKSTTFEKVWALKPKKKITKIEKQTWVPLSGYNEQLDLKLVYVGHLTNFWCLLTKSTTIEILWALKPKKEITKIKNQTCVLLRG